MTPTVVIRRRFVAIITISLISLSPSREGVTAFSARSPKSKSDASVRYWFRSVAATAAISAQVAGSLLLGYNNAAIAAEADLDWASLSRIPVSVDESNSSPQGNEAIEKLGLRPPTEEKPQIKFDGSGRPNVIPPQPGVSSILSKNSESRSPIVVGLVYMLKNTERPDFSDTLVLTATSPSDPETVLAGAKFPVANAKFPFSFSLYNENIVATVGGIKDWYRATETEDVIITARICPDDAVKIPCTDAESTFRARGICKLLKGLPGMSEGQVVRTPASLALE